jgi:hypothetical protein
MVRTMWLDHEIMRSKIEVTRSQGPIQGLWKPWERVWALFLGKWKATNTISFAVSVYLGYTVDNQSSKTKLEGERQIRRLLHKFGQGMMRA